MLQGRAGLPGWSPEGMSVGENVDMSLESWVWKCARSLGCQVKDFDFVQWTMGSHWMFLSVRVT